MITIDNAMNTANRAVKQIYGADALELKYLGGGSFGKAVLAKIDSEPYELVIKSYLNAGAHKLQEFEQNLIAEYSDIPVPKVYFTIDRGADISFDCMGMEYMKGVCPVNVLAFRSRKKKNALAVQIADCLDSIHSATSDNGKYGFVTEPSYGTWEDFYKQESENILIMAEKLFDDGAISTEILSLAKVSYSNYDKIFYEKTKKPSLVHGDLNLFNMLVDRKTLTLTCIFDTYGTMWADPAYDLFQFSYLPDKCGIYRECLNRLEIGEMTELRVAYYALFNEIKCHYLSNSCSKYLYNRQIKNLMYRLRLHKLN